MQKTDMRSLLPKNTIAYAEINDLQSALDSLTENKIFKENSDGNSDFSALKNVQAAVAITGFETSEKQVAEESAAIDLKPKFAVVIDTHRWNWQAVSLAQNQIGNFVAKNYGKNVRLNEFEKRDAKFFVWTNSGGEKIFAAVLSGVINVGNDETLIDNCLGVQRGELDNLLKNGNLSKAREQAGLQNLLGFGYVAPEGIKDFAEVAGASVAVRTSENETARNLIAQSFTKLLQNATKEIVWTEEKKTGEIEDNFYVYLNGETASILNQTLAVTDETRSDAAEFLPASVYSATHYNLQNPTNAWRGLLSATTMNVDSASEKYVAQFSEQILAPYGISNADLFLSAVDSDIYTAIFDAEGENSVVVVSVKDREKIRKSIAGINFTTESKKFYEAEILRSDDNDFSAAFIENKLILGTDESILKCLTAKKTDRT